MALSINFQRLRDRTNLRQQFGFAACLLCLIIVASVATGAAIVGERAVQTAAEKEMGEIAFSIADRLNRGFASRLHTLELLAEMRPIRSMIISDSVDASQLFDQALRAIPRAEWVAFIALDGTVRSASSGHLEGVNISRESWFQNCLNGSKVTEVQSFAPLEPFMRPLPDGEQRRFLTLTARVEDDAGRILGVFAALVDWREWAFDTINVTLQHRDETTTTGISVFDSEGEVLFRTAAETDMASVVKIAQASNLQRGAFTSKAIGEPTTIGYAHTYGDLGYGWTILSARSQPLSLGVLHGIVMAIVIIGTIVGLVGLIGAIFLARQLSNPICALADMADQLGRDERAMIPWLSGSSEVVRLSSALRGLVVRLGFSEREREEVESRAANDAKRFSNDIAMLRALADTDGLTRVLNRRGFMAFAEDAMGHYQRYDRPFAILMLDLDHFKSINDTYSHVAGDMVLSLTAGKISEMLRPTDRVGRFGGEEFIVLLREVTAEEAQDTAERIRRIVANQMVPFNDTKITVTVSIGLAAVDAKDRDIQDVIGRADHALYAAKNDGRNRVAVAPEASPLRKAG